MQTKLSAGVLGFARCLSLSRSARLRLVVRLCFPLTAASSRYTARAGLECLVWYSWRSLTMKFLHVWCNLRSDTSPRSTSGVSQKRTQLRSDDAPSGGTPAVTHPADLQNSAKSAPHSLRSLSERLPRSRPSDARTTATPISFLSIIRLNAEADAQTAIQADNESRG